MNDWLIGITLLAPLLVLATRFYQVSKWSLFIATTVAFAASLLLSTDTVHWHWLFLGSQFGINNISQWLLPVSLGIWAAAGVQHALQDIDKKSSARFRLFFLLAMFGNTLLLLAQDIASFYIGFSVMGIAGYGLVFRSESTNARMAASTYLRWTIAGELLLFGGLLSLAQQTGSTQLPLPFDKPLPVLTLSLLIGGFGIKIGLPGLHAWMPGAYASSNTSGSMVLSGAMANAGILGLLQFLPLQSSGYSSVGMILLVFGLVGAFYGVLFGLPQKKPKVILAYSSISQLSMLAAMTGLALAKPELAPALIIAITLYAVHHGLTKAALFAALPGLSSTSQRTMAIAVLFALSLTMAGLPYTTGAITKGLLKEALTEITWLSTLLPIASIATTLLMTRFLYAAIGQSHHLPSRSQKYAIGTAAVLTTAAHLALYLNGPLPAPNLHTVWPLLIAMIMVIGFALLPRRAHEQLQPTIPKGDLPAIAAKHLQRVVKRHPPSDIINRLWTNLRLSLATTREAKSPTGSSNPRTTIRYPDKEVTS